MKAYEQTISVGILTVIDTNKLFQYLFSYLKKKR